MLTEVLLSLDDNEYPLRFLNDKVAYFPDIKKAFKSAKNYLKKLRKEK